MSNKGRTGHGYVGRPIAGSMVLETDGQRRLKLGAETGLEAAAHQLQVGRNGHQGYASAKRIITGVLSRLPSIVIILL